RNALRLAVREPIVDVDIATLRPSTFFESLPERCDPRLGYRIVLGEIHQHADPPHPLWLLRARGKRPRDRSATHYFDEITPSHCLSRGSGQGIVSAQNNTGNGATHVRFGSKADICTAAAHVRFTPESGHVRCN